MRKLLVCLAFAVFTACSAFGQAMDGNLVGTVTDATGATVADANVTLENQQTNVRQSTKSNADGAYRFGNVPVGRYRLSVEKTGFQKSVIANIDLELNKTSTVNTRLEVGEVSTTVEVQAAATAIDTTTATVANSFNTTAAVQLPVTGVGTLGVINLSLLSAGVTSSGGAGYGTGPSVGGQRPTNNNFMIEGVDNNNRSVTGPVVNISNEAVAEFSLQQNQVGSEFGHSTGGQFNTVIRSGTNALHGSLYEYFQNRNLNAVDEAFARQGIRSNPRYDANRFGGTIGGPILKNKWFYFGNLEYNPVGQAATSSSLVVAPTAEGIRQLEAIPGISRSNLDQFKRWVPAPAAQLGSRTTTVSGRQIPLGTLNLAAPAYTNNMNYLVSSDYNLSERDQFRARYAYNRTSTIDTTANLSEFFTPVKFSAHLANFTWLHTFSPNVTSETRAGYTRRVEDRPVGDYSWPGLDVFPNIGLLDLGLNIGPNQNYPQGSRSNTIQFVNNTTATLGKHTMKFGYDGRKLNISSFFVQRLRGDYQYNSLERFMLDITPEFGQRSVGGFPFVGNLLSHYLYFNDEWRVRQNLTITLGLRYEYVGVPDGAKQHRLNSISSVPGVLEIREPRATKLDFAPRIGIAWNPGSDGKTSVRAGFGMAYDQIYQNLGTNSLPPQFFTTVDGHVERPNAASFLGTGGISGAARPITSPAIARALTASYVPDQLRPYSVVWNVGVQRVFRNDYTVELRYLGTRGIHLPVQLQLNRPAGVTSAERSLPLYYSRPSQADLDRLTLTRDNFQLGRNTDPMHLAGFTSPITAFMPRGNSTYHGMALQVNRRFSNGFQFVGSYTWSSNIDDSTAALFSTVTSPRRPQDFNNLRPERAHSALDHRHRFTYSGVYETQWFRGDSNWFKKNLIGNWLMSGTYTAQTGSWATFRSAADSNLNGDNAGDRTIFNPNGDRNIGSGVTALRNTNNQIVGYLANNPNAAWITAAEGMWANAGRNLVRFPGINNVDLTLGKRFSFRDRMALEIRGEFYNALNNSQYIPGFPNVANLRSRTGAGLTNALVPSQTNFQRWDLVLDSNARTGQLVARFTF